MFMLDQKIIKKIEDFVFKQPRSMQEIAVHIEKNWRTADRYINEIIENFGTISTKTFREGTRGALKIAYQTNIDKISHSVFQEKLEKEIMISRKKEDFSPFDIFQFVDDRNKKSSINYKEADNLEEYKNIILSAQKSVLFFSGNMSFINLDNKNINFSEVLDSLFKKNISIKILSRVDLQGKDNVEKTLAFNFKHKKELLEIRHDDQPIRGVIVDDKILRMKEVRIPTGKQNELQKQTFIYYTIKDKEWVEWISKIFWKKFNNSLDARKRLDELNKIRI